MTKTKKNAPLFSNITKQRIASSKGLQLFCALLTLVLDIAVMVMFFFNTSDLKFIVCPGLLLLLDILFLIKVLFSNYRFSYAIKGVFLHILSIILVCAYMIVSMEILDGRIIFATVALYAMPAVHLIQCLAAVINAFHAANKAKAFRHLSAICITVVFTAGVLLYGVFLFQNGFFGQGNKRTERTLVYTWDDEKKNYIVSGLLNGFGNTIVIPEEFDGHKVVGVDCSIFSDSKLVYVVFDCNTDIKFENADKLSKANKKLKFETGKDKLDNLRKNMFTQSLEKMEILSVANNLTPNDLADGEVYITFSYDRETLLMVNNVIIDTWFGHKNTVFKISDHVDTTDSIKYIDYSDSSAPDSLYWCMQNQNNMIFQGICDSDGNSIENTAISDSLQATLSFEKIYQIFIGEDNDDVYNLPESATSIDTYEGFKPYKLAVASRVMEVLEQIPNRNGFDKSFKIGADKHDLVDINQELAVLQQAGMTKIEVYPQWQLRAPTITKLEADGKAQNHSAVYGSNVQLVSEAVAPHEDILIKYEWKKEDSISQESSYTINNIHPNDAGEYTLIVTAYSENSSLTSTAVKTINVGFEKKEINYNWITPSDLMYSATVKEISAYHDQGDVINGDNITQQFNFELDSKNVSNIRDAGNYVVSVVLTSDASTKYKVAEDDAKCKFTVTPYSVEVQWGNEFQFVYNGSQRAPQATATGIGSDGSIVIKIDGKASNVGAYTAKVSTSNKNYALLDTERNYTITPKTISALIWEANTSFVYTSEAQSPKVSGLTGIVDKDKSAVLSAMIYEGLQVNAGNGYTVTAQLADTFPSKNYVLECDITETFSITPKPITLTIADLKAEYTGTVINHSRFSFSTSTLAKNDKIGEIVSIQYQTYLGGTKMEAVNVASSAYTISADQIPGEKYNNYKIEIVTGSLTITPKKMTVTLQNKEKTYDGVAFNEGYTFGYTGLIDTYDTFEEVVSKLSFLEVQEKNVGVYDIKAEVKTDGKGAKYDNYAITIIPATLKINKAPLVVKAVGITKVYDGLLFANTDFGIEIIEGTLYEGKTLEDLGTRNFTGRALSEKNVGTYALSVYLVSNEVNSNYSITYVEGSATITPRPIILTVKDASKIYNGQIGGTFDFDITADQLGAGDYKSSLGAITYGGAAVTAKDAGDYEITITSVSSGNYTIAKVNTGIFTINKKDIIVTPVVPNRTYDGVTVGGSFSITASGLIAGETVSVLGTPVYSGSAVAAKNAGTYNLTVVGFETDPKNYNVTQYNSTNFTVEKAQVTIKINSTSKVYDGKAVDLNSILYTVSGLRGNDTEDMLGTPSFSGTLTANTLGTVGNYSVTMVLPGNENYKESTVTSYYTITPKDITVTAVAKDKIYDGMKGEFSVLVDGLVAGEDVSVLGTPTFSGAAATATNVGDYVLQVRFSGSTGNYNVSYVNDTLTITPKDITVSAVANDKIYDGKKGNFFITANGLVAGEDVSVLGTPVFYGDAATATNVGRYTLQVKFNGSTGNYNVVYCFDTMFEITAKDITVTVVAPDKIYDGQAGGNFSITADGLAAGEDVSVLGTHNFYGDAVTAINVGEYTLGVSFDSTGNYNVINIINATFKITPKDVTVTAIADERAYEEGVIGGDFSFSIDGLVSGSEGDFNATFSGDAVTATEKGTYELKVEIVPKDNSNNYNFIYVDTLFTIS